MNRLEILKLELSSVFGRFTKWKLRCEEKGLVDEDDLVKMAEQVLSEPCTGTVSEQHWHRLGLEGVKSMHIDEFKKKYTKKITP